MNTLSHVAIIMDGNGRWAKKKNKSRKFGHFKGTQNIKPIVDHCLKKKIKYLTLFAFALDNWRRPKAEINYLFILFQNFFEENIDSLLKKNIRIRFIGEISKLPIKIKKIIKIYF
jgi:undecaprenyl diphosphate synthase